MMPPTRAYRGRFAPSPTGPLHFGSLVAAIGSYVDARHHGGVWLVRIEDVDRPRTVPGAADDILRTLDAFGLRWDGDVMYQSARNAPYDQALETLRQVHALYPCACSRREIADSALPDRSPNFAIAQGRARAMSGIDGPVYPGTCRNGLAPDRSARALRVRVSDESIMFNDRVLGEVRSNLSRDVGDFVVRRADDMHAYQLAVVVDDAAQGITDVVRGADLLGSTARQIYLYRLLGLPVPRYAHLPIVTNPAGEKLSKQTGATALDVNRAPDLLWRALSVLGQRPPGDLATESIGVIHEWARVHWKIEMVPAGGAYRFDRP